ncbi:MAG: hypothetical protein Q9175_003776 [Cornicularia normoerica]
MTELDSNVDADSGIRHVISHDERTEDALDILRLPKNRSTGDLLSGARRPKEDGKLRVSFDAGSTMGDPTARSPIMSEHEHVLGISGLRRIRQQPASRAPSHPSSPSISYTLPPRSSSMTVETATSQGFTVGGPSSPTLNFGEDLSRFPSESLHSFSFAHQSEGALHNRQSALKRAIEFMRERLGFGVNHPGVMTAQAKVSGDVEIQSMVDLLVRANILGHDSEHSQNTRQLQGPMTGPAGVEKNVFDNAFLSRSTSPEAVRKPLSVDQGSQQMGNDEFSRHGSSQPEPSLASEISAPDPVEPESPSSASPALATSHVPTTGLKRTNTDLSLLNLQTRLVEALAKPYKASDSAYETLLSPTPLAGFTNPLNTGMNTPSLVHGHNNRWVPAAQAVFTTETSSPWTILLANDLACLVFGVTKVEFKRLSMLEVVREDRRAWLEEKLRSPGSEAAAKARQAGSKSASTSPISTTSVKMSGGVTAQLLSKPPWRQQRAQTDEWKTKTSRGAPHHLANKSRGVLLCGDIVPIRKRNGVTGAASLWVKEKRGGLIWVLEEIVEDIATLKLDADLRVIESTGATNVICGKSDIPTGTEIHRLIPQMPKRSGSSIMSRTGFATNTTIQYFAARSDDTTNIPVTVTMEPDHETLRVSSFPYIAGIVVLSASNLKVMSSNSVFSAALFGEAEPSGQNINELIPQFEKILDLLTEEENVKLVDGIVVPEHSFRRARALLALREGNEDAAAIFLRPQGLIACHRDGSEINVDVQMRVVRSERSTANDAVIEEKSEDGDSASEELGSSEIVYALWITYSRQLHSALLPGGSATPNFSRPDTPHQPSPGQNSRSITPEQIDGEDIKPETSPTMSLTQQIKEATSQLISESPSKHVVSEPVPRVSTPKAKDLPKKKKKISDFVVLEDMGQGAYGQVKLARYAKPNGKKVVLKYVTKRRILVDTWTRDRRLGTVPLEIHVLDYLRRDELRHPNIVEMTDFFEDDVNYYIEMVPHGLPGMDLFDYIEMRSTMDEVECRNIFLQVVDALHHLHTKALVVHRDIKDENIILDGEGKVKLIDFGSAAYIKNGPFDVFVGTIDYAAPEVLQGKSYRGKEQDIWALGILLYTLVYKENPFYSIDEILDHELRIPWIMSAANIELIKQMLDRDIDRRLTISQVREAGWCREGGDR